MASKVWIFLKENKLIAFAITTSITLLASTPKAVRAYNNHVIAKHQQEVVDSTRAANLDSMIFYFTIVRRDINTIKENQEDQGDKTEQIIDSQKKLRTYMENKAATKQDLQEVSRIFENEKKNEIQ